MADAIGSASYELSADRTKLKADLDAAAQEIQQTGAVAEQGAADSVSRSVDKFGQIAQEGQQAIAGASATAFGAIQTSADQAATAVEAVDTSAAQGALDALATKADDTGTSAQGMGQEFNDAASSVDTSDAQGSLDDLAAGAHDAGEAAQGMGQDFEEAADKASNLSLDAVFSKENQRALKESAKTLDEIAGTNFSPIVNGLVDVSKMAKPFQSTIESALGGAFEKIGQTLAPITQKAGAFIGGAVGEAQAIAQQAAATGTAAISAMATKVAAMGIPLAPAGTTVGTAVGAAMSAGMIAGAVAGLGAIVVLGAQALQNALPEQERDLAVAYNNAFNDAMRHGVSIEAAEAAGRAARDLVQAQIDAAKDEFDNQAPGLTAAGVSAFTGFRLDAKAAATGVGTDVGAEFGRSVSTSFDDNLTLASKMDKELGNVADTIRNNESVVGSAMDDLTYVMTHKLEIAADVAEIKGQLTGTQLRDGLASTDPLIHAQAMNTYNILIGQYQKLTGQAWTAGNNAGNAYERGYIVGVAGLGSFNPFKDPGRDPNHKGPGGLASGGDLDEGEWAWTGEEGPELRRGGKGGEHIFSHAESMALISALRPGGEGPTREIHHYHTPVTLNVGTLVADEAGLAELDRRLEDVRNFNSPTRSPLGGAY